MPWASCSFSETWFLTQLFELVCFISPLSTHISIPSHFQPTSALLLALCLPPVFSPFPTFHTPECLCHSSLFRTYSGSSVSPRRSHTPWQSMQELLALTHLFSLCHHCSFVGTLLVARHAVPEHTRFSLQPVCLCTCHSFDQILA